MKAAGLRRTPLRGYLIAVGIVLLSAALALYAYTYSSSYPATDDATIDADVVHVSSSVGGRIVRLAVKDNQHVKKGDVLFEIDAVPYQLTVKQAQADVELAKAALETRRRSLIGERAKAEIASGQSTRANHNYELASRTVKRLAPLAAQGYVPAQQLDQAQVAQRDAAISLQQAEEQKRASAQTIGNDDDAIATLHAREAALARAQHALEDTVVRAPHDGWVTGLSVLSGETVAPGQSLFTLIHSGEWFAVANFRETALSSINVGDCATVFSMIDRSQAIQGKVDGIGAGVASTDRINLPRTLPIVQPSVNWVRVEQRFPVRIRLEKPADRLVRVGASAIVEIKHGAACR
jgi:multidrug efflux system membrane fusion protein